MIDRHPLPSHQSGICSIVTDKVKEYEQTLGQTRWKVNLQAKGYNTDSKTDKQTKEYNRNTKTNKQFKSTIQTVRQTSKRVQYKQ